MRKRIESVFVIILCVGLLLNACGKEIEFNGIEPAIISESIWFQEDIWQEGDELNKVDEVLNVDNMDTIIESMIDYQSIEDDVYQMLVQEMIETEVFPATDGIQCSGMPYDNRYSVMDIDDDGKDELIINYANASCMAAMVLLIYDYDRKTGEIYTEYVGWPHMTIYDNGYIKADASHNHGRSDLDYFWPYSLSLYNAENDKYEFVASIDAWQYQIAEDMEPDPEFPNEKDIDGDGIVYYDISENYYEPTLIMDNDEYDIWCKKYTEGKEKKITWNQIISEEKYYEMFPVHAVG